MIEQRVALRRHLAHARADHDHQIGGLDARQQLRVDADARDRRHSDGCSASNRCARRNVVATGNAKRSAKRASAAHAVSDQRLPPSDHERALRAPIAASAASPCRSGPARSRPARTAARHSTAMRSTCMSSGSAITTGPGRPLDRGIEGARHDFRNARRVVDLGHPFGDRAEHRAIIDFLQRLALAHVARDLADEHDQRRRILARDVQAGATHWWRPARGSRSRCRAGRSPCRRLPPSWPRRPPGGRP